MLNITPINADTLNETIFEEVLFFSLAERGAMGRPGEIIVVNSKPAAYSMQTYFGEVSYQDIARMFPIIKQCGFGLFGFDSEVPDGWNYVNLGMGNHLIVADEVYEEFQKLTKDCKSEPEYYQAWLDAASKITSIKDKE